MNIPTIALALYLHSTPANAGWWRDFCERHLIADDTWPYAELTNEQLFKLYGEMRTEKYQDLVLKELVYRFRNGGMSEADRCAFTEKYLDKKRDSSD